MPTPRGTTIVPAAVKKLYRLVEKSSESDVAKALGCTRATLARALAGRPVYAPTVRAVERLVK